MIKKNLIVLIIFLVSFISVQAKKASIIILGTNHVPPFKIIDGVTLRGINADVLKEIFHGMGLELKIKKCPWKRCLTELENGNIDVFLGLFKTPDREKLFYYCNPPYKNRSDKAFYLRKGEGYRINKYEDLYKIGVIGVTRGYKNFARFDNDLKLQKEFVTDHNQNIKKLLGCRLDVFIQTEEAADYHIKTNGYMDKIEKAPYKYGNEQPSYFVISRKSSFMLRKAEFEANLNRFVQSKRYNQISERWTK